MPRTINKLVTKLNSEKAKVLDLKIRQQERMEQRLQKMHELEEVAKSQQDIEAKERVLKRLEEQKERRSQEREDRLKAQKEWVKKRRELGSSSISFTIQSLEDHKEVLKQKRMNTQAIDHREFAAFEKEYLEKRKLFVEQKKKEKMEYYNNLGIHMNAPLEYPLSTKWNEIKEREQQEQKLKELEDERIRNTKDKQSSYAKLVKQMHWPKVSDIKRKEITERINKLNEDPTRNKSKALTTRHNKSMVSHTSNSILTNRVETTPALLSPIKQYYRYQPKRKPRNHQLLDNEVRKRVKQSTTIVRKPAIDYLKEIRLKRELETDNDDPKTHRLSDWRTLNKSNKYDEKTKLQMIKDKAITMDMKIQFKEQVIKHKGLPLDETSHVNNMIMDSIEAKLAILNTINNSK